MKKFFAVILMVVSFSAFAGNDSETVRNAGFARLSEAEKAEVIKMVADKAASKDASVPAALTEDKVEKWVKIGSNIGQGLAGAAKEVGVAVNDFSQTPVGQLTMLLIVWHMIGAQLIHVFGGIMIWIVGIAIIRHMVARAYPSKITYSKEVKNVFGNYAVEKVEPMAIDDSNAAGWLFAYGIVLIAGLIAIFTF
jgi:hypothetical protein